MRTLELAVAPLASVGILKACVGTPTAIKKQTPTGPTPPDGKIPGKPDFSFKAPSPFSLFLEASTQVHLMHWIGEGSAEELRLGLDAFNHKTSASDPTITVGGDTQEEPVGTGNPA